MRPKTCPICECSFTSRYTYCGRVCAGRAGRKTHTCSVPECGAVHHKHGFCEKHAQRWLLRGTTAPTPGNEWRDQTESERFWSKVDKSGSCWIWTGEVNNKGYGRFRTYDTNPPRRHLAHRYALRDLGLLDESKIILHSCDNPPCVNPDHLNQGTHRDNVHDALRKGRLNMSGLELGNGRVAS